jgi:hypothetical protein
MCGSLSLFCPLGIGPHKREYGIFDAHLSSIIFLTASVADARLSGMKVSRQLRDHYSKIGRLGSLARNKKLTPARKREIAKKAANARWKQTRDLVTTNGESVPA